MKSQSGFLLVTAIFLLVILAALGAFILTISGTQQTSSALDVQGSRAYQAARAGIEWASYQAVINGCAGYLYERSVTIDHTKVPNTDQSNFPVLFSGTYAGGGGSLDLRTVANGGKVTNASGFDIIFTDSAGAKLDHEIESYSATTGAVNFWVRVPTVSFTTDTVIYLCYGNAAISTSQENKTGVWDSNYLAVWHLKEATGVTNVDSTSNNHNGTPTNGPTTSTGKIGAAQNYDGLDDYTLLAGTWSLVNSSLTVHAWIKSASLPPSGQDDWFALKTSASLQMKLHMAIMADGRLRFGFYNQDLDTGAGQIAAGQWYHVVSTYNFVTDTSTTYINGAFVISSAQGPFLGASPTGYLGWGGDAANWFTGQLDEVRVSNVARSADWVKTEYNNQSSPSTFYALGAENAGSAFATLCNPGPTTQNVTGMGGTLSGFTAAVTCSSTTYTEGAATWTVYQITSNGAQGTAGTLDRVERELQVTLIK